MFRLDTPELFDLMIASAGGCPYGINMCQAQKGLENTFRIAKPGGCVVYFAGRSPGSDNRLFDEWVSRHCSAAAMQRELKKAFVIGGHKAYRIARLMEKGTAILVSELNPAHVRQFRMLLARDAAEALAVREQLGPALHTAVVRWAGFTLPTPVGSESGQP